MNGYEGKARGFTLMELMVALFIFTAVLYVAYHMFFSGVRTFRSEEGKSSSLLSAMLAYELIYTDLKRNMYYGESKEKMDELIDSSKASVYVEDGGSRIHFLVPVSLSFDTPYAKMEYKEVSYSLVDSGNPDYKYLCRQCGNEQKVYRNIRLRSMNFRLETVMRDDGAMLFFLLMKIVGYSEQEKDVNVACGLAALDAFTLRSLHPYWREDWFKVNGYFSAPSGG